MSEFVGSSVTTGYTTIWLQYERSSGADILTLILDSDDEKKLLELIENEDKCKILLKLLDKVTHNK
jgi:hypothetical protein